MHLTSNYWDWFSPVIFGPWLGRFWCQLSRVPSAAECQKAGHWHASICWGLCCTDSIAKIFSCCVNPPYNGKTNQSKSVLWTLLKDLPCKQSPHILNWSPTALAGVHRSWHDLRWFRLGNEWQLDWNRASRWLTRVEIADMLGNMCRQYQQQHELVKPASCSKADLNFARFSVRAHRMCFYWAWTFL